LERKLEQQTRQCQAAQNELESFCYAVSHDLRAPLRAIHGFARILTEDYRSQLDPEAAQLLGSIERNTRRMFEQINGLLEFSRLLRHPFERRSVDMAQLVKQALAELESAREGRSVELKVSALPGVHGDRSLLQRVWYQLLSNALKFTRPRAQAIIEVGAVERPGEWLFHVRDNGVGFNMKYAEKLFGVFQHLHSIEDFEGPGIGLAMVKRIIDWHGGRVWTEAEPERGAAFFFTLPATTV
jgi:light-regulated signal transduction histidine kinase (bacteriophytochrome)